MKRPAKPPGLTSMPSHMLFNLPVSVLHHPPQLWVKGSLHRRAATPGGKNRECQHAQVHTMFKPGHQAFRAADAAASVLETAFPLPVECPPFHVAMLMSGSPCHLSPICPNAEVTRRRKMRTRITRVREWGGTRGTVQHVHRHAYLPGRSTSYDIAHPQRRA